MKYVAKLRKTYAESVVPALQQRFSYKNPMQVPAIEKICINQGVGKAVQDKKLIDSAVEELTLITGQKPMITYSKKDISNFKLRKGVPIGVKVTLRSTLMYEFLDKLIAVSLPRTRDFKGISAKGFDGRGNFTFGISEQIIFPEIDIDKIKNISGMDITVVTSAKTDEEAKALLDAFGFPFQKK
jgi:large subunit ribosomal protein L5